MGCQTIDYHRQNDENAMVFIVWTMMSLGITVAVLMYKGH